MKYNILYLWLFAFCLGAGTKGLAQNYTNTITYNDTMVFIHLDKTNKKEYKNLAAYFHIQDDSLFSGNNICATLKADGWYLISITKKTALIGKKIEGDISAIDWLREPIFIDFSAFGNSMQFGQPGTPGFPLPVKAGINSFKTQPSVIKNSKGESVFFLKGSQNAKTVYVSGNFNLWSTTETPMQKTDSGWVAALQLPAGKYLYKFIVDGNWQYDNNNLLKESDGYKSFNSTYYCYNYTWTTERFTDARKVFLTGSFIDWNTDAMPMQKTDTGWKLDMYLQEGSYTYKFIVDNTWVVDPDNADVLNDGSGNYNSFMQFGNPYVFELKGYTDAKNVILAGTFNNWNGSELQMEKTETGWQIAYVLGEGQYAYRYIVDGNWMPDPDNPLSEYTSGYQNSVVIVKPNYLFQLNGYSSAQQVFVSGNFNGWAEPGFPMQRTADGWEFQAYLPPGKCIYKYVVDGKWIVDPGNPMFENNEYDSYNSVIWIKPDYLRNIK